MGPMSFASLTDGLVNKAQWPDVEKKLRDDVDQCVAGGCKGIITFAGQRKDMSFEQGLDLTVEFMNRVKAMLEDKGVTLKVVGTAYSTRAVSEFMNNLKQSGKFKDIDILISRQDLNKNPVVVTFELTCRFEV